MFLSVTVAPGRTPCCASETTPSMSNVGFCAAAGAATAARQARMQTKRSAPRARFEFMQPPVESNTAEKAHHKLFVWNAEGRLAHLVAQNGGRSMSLDGQIAVVTGATRGVGRGVGRELARQGARVFVTGRSAPDYERIDEGPTAVRCDHRHDAEVEAAFKRILDEAGQIDVLVNSAWGGY